MSISRVNLKESKIISVGRVEEANDLAFMLQCNVQTLSSPK